MPRQTTEAFFRRPPEKVWRMLTDPVQWVWPGGPAYIRTDREGMRIVTEDKDGLETLFRITAFAPHRWYAVEVENRETAGTCEALLFPERGGTRVEFTADIHGKTPKRKLLLRLRLKQWQQQYVECLKRSLEGK